MARKPLTGDVIAITETVGKTWEGTYRGSRLVDIGKEKPATAHAMVGKDGVPYEFWGSAIVNNALHRVGPGTYLWLTYKGKIPTKNGKAHDFDIEFDDETGGPTANATADPTVGAPPPFDPDDIPA